MDLIRYFGKDLIKSEATKYAKYVARRYGDKALEYVQAKKGTPAHRQFQDDNRARKTARKTAASQLAVAKGNSLPKTSSKKHISYMPKRKVAYKRKRSFKRKSRKSKKSRKRSFKRKGGKSKAFVKKVQDVIACTNGKQWLQSQFQGNINNVNYGDSVSGAGVASGGTMSAVWDTALPPSPSDTMLNTALNAHTISDQPSGSFRTIELVEYRAVTEFVNQCSNDINITVYAIRPRNEFMTASMLTDLSTGLGQLDNDVGTGEVLINETVGTATYSAYQLIRQAIGQTPFQIPYFTMRWKIVGVQKKLLKAGRHWKIYYNQKKCRRFPEQELTASYLKHQTKYLVVAFGGVQPVAGTAGGVAQNGPFALSWVSTHRLNYSTFAKASPEINMRSGGVLAAVGTTSYYTPATSMVLQNAALGAEPSFVPDT